MFRRAGLYVALALLSLLFVLLPECPVGTEPGQGQAEAQETQATTADPRELYDALWDAIKSHQEQHYFDTAKRMAQELSAEDLTTLLEGTAQELKRALKRADELLADGASDEEYELQWRHYDDVDSLCTAVGWALAQQGPEALRPLLALIAELGLTESDWGDLPFMAAWIALSYSTTEQLQAAKRLIQESPAVWGLFEDEENWAFDPSALEQPYEEDETWTPPHREPMPFDKLQATFDEITSPGEYEQWYAPEGRAEEVPWGQSRYNPASWEVTASSAADGHPAEACLDGDVTTFWCPEEGDEEPWIRFRAPERLTFWYHPALGGLLVTLPGAGTDLTAFLEYGRPTGLRVEFGDGTHRDSNIEYGTVGEARTHLFEPPLKWEHVAARFTIRILEWEDGQARSAPAISEVRCEPKLMAEAGDGMTPIALE